MYPSILCVRETDVDGCGGYAQVFLLLDRPQTSAETEKFREAIDRAKAKAEEYCLDTELIVRTAYEDAFGYPPRVICIDEMEF